MLGRVIATLVVVTVGTVSLKRYRSLNNTYDRTRVSVPSDKSFRWLYRVLAAVAALTSIAAFWSDAAPLYKLHDSNFLRAVGSLASVGGLIAFEVSSRQLGMHYSPSFDLRVPTSRVTKGLYGWLSHPMYVSNTTILLGAFVASGSPWVLIPAVIVVGYYVRSARTERRLLLKVSCYNGDAGQKH